VIGFSGFPSVDFSGLGREHRAVVGVGKLLEEKKVHQRIGAGHQTLLIR